MLRWLPFQSFPFYQHLKITSSCRENELTLSVGKVRFSCFFSLRMISPSLNESYVLDFHRVLLQGFKGFGIWLSEPLSSVSSFEFSFISYIFLASRDLYDTFNLIKPAFTDRIQMYFKRRYHYFYKPW